MSTDSAAIAVVNAGSSSVKFSLFAWGGGEALELVARGQVEGLPGRARFRAVDALGRVSGERAWPDGSTTGHAQAVHHILAFLRERAAGYEVVGVGHRVVHGGERFAEPVVVDDATMRALEALVPLAPLHQPHNLAAIRAVGDEAPSLPQVACFDTAFHRTQPRLASAFALPKAITDRGVQRYGFHGLSYEYIARVLPAVDARAAGGRTIVAHLGNGASMCALADGASVATTMGMTALDGLMMGTRAGSLDPGVIVHLVDALGMSARDVERLLYHESGLKGVSGVSSDMRTLLASPDPRAAFAVELFCYRACREIGSLAAALGGLDALVFTGGIGENAAPVRESIVRASAWLGFALDDAANAANGPRITTLAARAAAYVIATNEELMIARHVAARLARV
jgi:acetate kinase